MWKWWPENNKKAVMEEAEKYIRLWQMVLIQLYCDIRRKQWNYSKKTIKNYNENIRAKAIKYLKGNEKELKFVCELANFNYKKFKERLYEEIEY